VGLLSEEINFSNGEQLGNFPQALSHIGLVNASWSIQQAETTQSAALTVQKGFHFGAG
jgi:GH15 family glucan-1,4-alpha-glucosidase